MRKLATSVRTFGSLVYSLFTPVFACNAFITHGVLLKILSPPPKKKIGSPKSQIRKSQKRWSANLKSANCYICGRSANLTNLKSPQIYDLLCGIFCGPPTFDDYWRVATLRRPCKRNAVLTQSAFFCQSLL
jgi:hypothetical protein